MDDEDASQAARHRGLKALRQNPRSCIRTQAMKINPLLGFGKAALEIE